MNGDNGFDLNKITEAKILHCFMLIWIFLSKSTIAHKAINLWEAI